MHSKVVVLGGGPGGYAAAFMAADAGLEVTLVESDARLGGTCLLRGCIPSKALLHVAQLMAEVRHLGEEWGVHYGSPKVELDALRSRKEQVIERMSGGLRQLAERRNVQCIRAHGVFENSTTLRLEGDDGSIPNERLVTFEHCIVATGSQPAMPASFAVDSPRVMDSTQALELADVPRRMLVVGGGYIGLEMGTVYAQLGAEVTVVELTDGLLPGADRDLVRPLERRLKKLFQDRIFLNTRVGSLGDHGDEIEVAFEGPNKFGRELYERVLVSVGRRPNSRGIGLENTQVTLTRQGFIECDAQQRTADPHILAIGDVAGEPMLAHKATHEAKVGVAAMLGQATDVRPTAIPAVVFTDPEIAWTGLTENEAKQTQREYQVAAYPWAASGRAQALGLQEGLTKWIVDPKTERVLGCGMVGTGAGELIAEATLAIEMQCSVRDVTDTIHPHPTLSETVMNAGEVFHGTAVEIYKPKR